MAIQYNTTLASGVSIPQAYARIDQIYTYLKTLPEFAGATDA